MWDLPTRSLSHKDLGEASGRKVIRREELHVVKVALEVRGQDTLTTVSICSGELSTGLAPLF